VEKNIPKLVFILIAAIGVALNALIYITSIRSFYYSLVLTMAMLLAFIIIRLLNKAAISKAVSEKDSEILRLKEKAAEKNEVERLKEEFVFLATHQIRSPLAAIKGYASMSLEGDYGHLSSGIKDVFETISESSDNLLSLINEFLDVSRIESGHMKYQMEKIDIKKIVVDSTRELTPKAKKKKLKIDFSYEKSDSYYTNGDAQKIKMIIHNLIDNAVTYTKLGWIKVKLTNKKNIIRLEVADSGLGIAQDELTLLFNKFTRTKTASEASVNGSGIGLYLAKNIIDAHEGEIWVESKGLGKGSTFILELKESK